LTFLFTFAFAETFFEEVFNKSEKKFNDAVQDLFYKFDLDKNGKIDGSDMEAFWSLSKSTPFFHKQVEKTKDFLWKQIKDFDKDGDDQVTFDEFMNGLQSLKDNESTVDRSICPKVLNYTQSCSDTINNSTIRFLKARIAVEHVLCKSGVSGIMNYKTEVCVVNSASCDEAISCYDDAEKSLSLVPGAGLVKRSMHGWFWVSVIVLGIFAVPSLIFLPFYIIVVMVAAKGLDWDRIERS
jgi:hypothetical protein